MKSPSRGSHISLEEYGDFQVIIGPNPNDEEPTIGGWNFTDDGKEWLDLPIEKFRERRIR